MTNAMTRKMEAMNQMAKAGNMKDALEIYISKYRNIAPKTFAKMAQDKQDAIIAEGKEICAGFKWGKGDETAPEVVETAPEAPKAPEKKEQAKEKKEKKEKKVSRPMLSAKEIAGIATNAGLEVSGWTSSDKTINIKLAGKTVARMIIGRDVRFSVKADFSTSVANATGAEMHQVNRPIPCVFKLTADQVSLAVQAIVDYSAPAEEQEENEEE